MYAVEVIRETRTPQQEEALFYEGYGPTSIDPDALAYYRYERIVEDIAVYCEQLIYRTTARADREQALHYLMSNFLPNGTIEIAYRADKTLYER
jgi:spectinomycin phosphotransferase